MQQQQKKSKKLPVIPKNHAPYQVSEEGEAIVEYLEPSPKWERAFAKLMKLDSP